MKTSVSIILFSIIIFLYTTTFAEIWNPKLWIPEPMTGPVTVYILSDKEFEVAAILRGLNPDLVKTIGGFAVWKNSVNQIYLRFNRLDLFPHEVRHLQEGQYHIW